MPCIKMKQLPVCSMEFVMNGQEIFKYWIKIWIQFRLWKVEWSWRRREKYKIFKRIMKDRCPSIKGFLEWDRFLLNYMGSSWNISVYRCTGGRACEVQTHFDLKLRNWMMYDSHEKKSEPRTKHIRRIIFTNRFLDKRHKIHVQESHSH